MGTMDPVASVSTFIYMLRMFRLCLCFESFLCAKNNIEVYATFIHALGASEDSLSEHHLFLNGLPHIYESLAAIALL